MIRKKKAKSNQARVEMSLLVDWVIIDKRSNVAIGIFNPHGDKAALRRVAVATAISHKIVYDKVKVIPVEMLSEETQTQINLAAAPQLLDPKAQKAAKK